MRVRYAQTTYTVNPKREVAVAIFVGDTDVSHELYAAARWRDALARYARLKRTGYDVTIRWVNIGPWCGRLWLYDMMRPRGMHPDQFYGRLVVEGVEVR